MVSGEHLRTPMSVSGTTAPEAVLLPIATTLISTPAAVLHTLLSHMQAELHPIVMPLIWHRWQELIEEAGLLNEFADVPAGLRNGFRLGITSTITSVFSPKNHSSAIDNSDLVDAFVAKEVAAGHYSRPYDPDDFLATFGPYRTSPLGVIFKPKPCLIQDHSFSCNHPHIHSINSEINSSNFKCDWGSFMECFVCVLNTPPGTQVAVFDVDAAHRHMPVAPEDRLHV